MSSYEKRILIPLQGDETINLYSLGGLLLARGYARVVIGKRGPYVEFEAHHVNFDDLHVPEEEEWRWTSSFGYYCEYRSNDTCNVKIYLQKSFVDYADYIIGKYYISPFDLCTKTADNKLHLVIEKPRQLSLF